VRLQPAGPAAATRSPDWGRPPRIFAGYVVDLDGTVYIGDQPLPGAVDALARIRAAGSRVVFLTNNPLRSAAEYAGRLEHLGIQADEREVVTPLAVLTSYLRQHHSGAPTLTIAEPLVDQTLEAAGFTVTSEPAEAGVVVVSFDRTFDYTKLLRAFRAVRGGSAAIVATNPDPFCPSPDGGLPDCAAMLAAVEACTGAKAEAVLGKPGPQMAAEVRSRLAVQTSDAAMVGDRILTDVAMSRALGMTSILVLSGATGPDDVAGSSVQPDYVIDNLAGLLPPERPENPENPDPPARPREPQ
jgi:HAD superfamily hydrolase (TIGR01450 family)